MVTVRGGLPGVMEMLRHSQIGITMNTYAPVAPLLQRDAAEALEAALFS